MNAEISKEGWTVKTDRDNWLNTGHSREFWLCEFAGRAMGGELSSDPDMAGTDEYEYSVPVEYASKLVLALESHLKGSDDAQSNPQD